MTEREEMDGSDGTREDTEDTTMIVQIEEVKCVIWSLCCVTKLSPVYSDNEGNREEGRKEGKALNLIGPCRPRCFNQQPSSVFASQSRIPKQFRARTTFFACPGPSRSL